MDTNKKEISTKGHEAIWSCFNGTQRPKGIPLGARASRPHNDGPPGARASRPHHAWHSLGHLLHLDQPATAPWLSYGLADAVPAERVAACGIAPSSAAAKGTACGRDARAPGQGCSRRQGGLPAASHGSSAAAKGTGCGRDARAPGQGCSRRQGGCLRHRTEAQRQPKGQHAGGTPALPGKAKTGIMVYTFQQCINHSLRGSSWITLFSPSRPLADPYRSSSNPFVDIFFLSEARPRYFSPDGTRRMRGERLKEP